MNLSNLRNHRVFGFGRQLLLSALILVMLAVPAVAIDGVCSDCHTMHNSQGGASMNFDSVDSSKDIPNAGLTRRTCLGCHAQGGGEVLPPTVAGGADQIPQVYHSNPTDLAAGNFGWIDGTKPGGAGDGSGHNIVALTGAEASMTTTGSFGMPVIPGGIVQTGHNDYIISGMGGGSLGCAGANGCHGYRGANPAVVPDGITGAHHANSNGQLAAPTDHADSYRFLAGVKGYEDSDWEFTKAEGDHNEYYGTTTPLTLGCGTGATGCHGSNGGFGGGVQATDGTMSQFCASCHGNFHTITNGQSSGIGPDASSPFIRHPTDVLIPDATEYAAFTSYNLNVPVARTSVPATPLASVTPGSDVVMCLSCHRSHASEFPDMLRWDYANDCNAGSANADCGCFSCHTSKDD